jgi:septum formation protein
MKKIILASASPRRKQLLKQAEIIFDIIVSDTDESYPAELPIPQVPNYIALQKAKAVQAITTEECTIIAADTIVVIDNEILGKPTSEENAMEILQKLSGKTHQVITGVCIFKNNNIIEITDTTNVTFHTLSTEQIKHYVTNYRPYDKAGAYAIQEWIGVVGIKQIDGCFYNVMGLPVSKILPYLDVEEMLDH